MRRVNVQHIRDQGAVRLRVMAVCLLWGATAAAQETVAVDPSRSVTAEAVLTKPVTVSLERVTVHHALDLLAGVARVQIQYQTAQVEAATKRVTLRVTHMPLGVALSRVLEGTGLQVHPIVGDHIAIVAVPADQNAPTVQGIIAGTVTDARTKQPLRGAKVGVDDQGYGTETGSDGTYRLASVSAGAHTVHIRMLGYSRATRTVTVNNDETVRVDVVLEAGANTLDQIVVTGTVIPTELKAVPNAITVITAKQIEERGITRIDQLFRGEVPGVFAVNAGSMASLDEVIMFSRGATALSYASAGTTNFNGTAINTNPIKTYMDGVELADPKYLSQIDPKSIERIEILTGPQASTIYGSNAINGVMQIFTKRGTGNIPQLTLNLSSGVVQNDFSSALTPQHDYSAQVNGTQGQISYNAGGSWNYTGAWTPARKTARTSGFGGTRLSIPTNRGSLTADVTVRLNTTQNFQYGDPLQSSTRRRQSGWYVYVRNFTVGLPQQTTSVLTGQTLGLTLGYAPIRWWSHEFVLGEDSSDLESRTATPGYRAPFDSTLSLTTNHTNRQSLRYTTTTQVPMTSLAHATLTLGADSWRNIVASLSVAPQALTGTLTGSTTLARQPGHNTGAFLQTQIGIADQLFLTYGLRAEWNPDFGEKAQPNYAPRYGISYSRDLGAITGKLRVSYGRSTRPPAVTLKDAQSMESWLGTLTPSVLQDYGSFGRDRVLANPGLAPERQQGGEGGLELYFGTRASMIVTRFNQTVQGLIAPATIDSIRSLAPNPSFYDTQDVNGYGYIWNLEYLNIGGIRNQGWEVQGTATLGPLTTHGVYSWTKSRSLGIPSQYAFYSSLAGVQTQPGASFLLLPEHTWTIGTSYIHARSSVTLTISGSGRLPNTGDELFYEHLTSAIRLAQNRYTLNPFSRVTTTAAYSVADLTAQQRLTTSIQGFLQVNNLGDSYKKDFSAQMATLGRQTKLGLQWRL